jgi:hypothetical protein
MSRTTRFGFVVFFMIIFAFLMVMTVDLVTPEQITTLFIFFVISGFFMLFADK